MTKRKAYILYQAARSNGNYSCWLDDLKLEYEIVDDFLPGWAVPDDAGILITHMHYRWEELSFLRRVLEKNYVPILILADGILEYRNTWEHPDLVDGSLFQPLFGHKLACIGNAQARFVSGWGNPRHCEVVGLPRLDGVEETWRRNPEGRFQLMVVTANTPSFNEQQRLTVKRSIESLQAWLERHPVLDQRKVEVTWRLSDGLDHELDSLDLDDEVEQPSLADLLNGCDAVITTPSTVYLESALRGIPTALLDFHNCPQYLSPAWNLGATEHFDQVIPELANPPEHKLLFQRQTLSDQLACTSPAKPRLLKLINEMLEIGQTSLRERQPLSFPDRILGEENYPASEALVGLDLQQLYPGNPAFENSEDNAENRLKIELAAAIRRLEELPTELSEKNRYINKMRRILDRSRVRVEEMHNRVVAIRKRFGVEPVKPKVDGRNIAED